MSSQENLGAQSIAQGATNHSLKGKGGLGLAHIVELIAHRLVVPARRIRVEVDRSNRPLVSCPMKWSPAHLWARRGRIFTQGKWHNKMGAWSGDWAALRPHPCGRVARMPADDILLFSRTLSGSRSKRGAQKFSSSHSQQNQLTQV